MTISIDAISQQYGGNRSKAAADIAMRGWNELKKGTSPDAMRRLSQAWLLDSSNGVALEAKMPRP